MARTDGAVRQAAVVGQPVGHSLSPVLHRAAYEALGLTGWTYDRIEADADALPGLVTGLGAQWAGLSVTMPGKRAALQLASEVTDRAGAVGAANTLVHTESGGWLADCTDVDGVIGALRMAAGYTPIPDAPGVVLGAGGTAAATVAAFAALGIERARMIVRDPARATDTRESAERAGVEVTVHRWSDVDFARLAEEASVVVSTVPAAGSAPHAVELAGARCLLDAVYSPWPTPLAEAVSARGGRLATGLDMLLHQAFGQVTQFTGLPAPREHMRAALGEATGNIVPLPIER